MWKKPTWIFFTCLFLSIHLGFSQNDTLQVSLRIEDQTLEEILDALEQKYPITFLIASQDLPNQTFSYEFFQEPLRKVIAEILSPTEFGAIFYRAYAVVIGPKEEIEQDYSINYYSVLSEELNNKPEPTETQRIAVGKLELLKPDGRAFVTGRVQSRESQKVLESARVSLLESPFQIETNAQGVFQVNLPAGTHTFLIERIGYDSELVPVQVLSDGVLEITLSTKTYELETVVVEAESPEEILGSAQVGITRLSIEKIRKLPSFLGEVDVVRGLLLQPGISTVGEASNGFNVRGGTTDQNLTLQDGAVLFNTSHALGLFSSFNSDLVREVSLYKGNIPAEYGGRIASVLDVKLKTGSYNKWLLNGGIGPVSGRLSLEGPLIKDKTSLLLGLRSSYSDWILRRINNPDINNSSAFFLDGNLKLSHQVNESHQVSLSGYFSEDDFDFAQEFGFSYQSTAATAEWLGRFGPSWRSEFQLGFSQFESTQRDFTGNNASNWTTGVDYIRFKEKLFHSFSEVLAMSIGIEATLYQIAPGSIVPSTPTSLVTAGELEEVEGREAAIFSQIEWEPTPRLKFLGGIRLNSYQYLGPKAEKNFFLPEPRISMNFRINDRMALKGGYSRTSQFINQISQLDSPTPTNVWQLGNAFILPFQAHNSSVGLFRTSINATWESSIELYFRGIDVLYDYRDFAQLVMNPNLEEELVQGTGRAYGLELSIKKNTGSFTGWLSYTLSRTERSVPEINSGDWYPSNFDKTHDISWVSTYQFNRRHSVSMNFTFTTGRPTTIPVGSFQSASGLFIPDYSLRNQARIPDYHRLDLSYTLGRGYKRNRKFDTSWTFSLFNVYSRRNAYSVFFVQEPFRRSQAFRLSILGGIFPALTYNLTMR
ncbi:MAG: carboxypeptidase-like regulatory domain-containing protein [Bacteroidota bacterium]